MYESESYIPQDVGNIIRSTVTLISDDNLFSNSATADEIKIASKIIGDRFLDRIESSNVLPELKFEDMLCFLDVASILAADVVRGFLITPSEEVKSTYDLVIKELLDDYKSVAAHPVFKAGLPLFDSNYKPETQNELESHLTLANQSKIESSYIVNNINISEQLPNQPTVVKKPELQSYPIMIENLSKKDRYGTEDTSVFTNINRYIELLKNNENKLLSSRGRRLAQVFIVPVSCWIKRSNNRMNYLFYGSFFMGLDKCLNEQDELHLVNFIRMMVIDSIGAASRNQLDQLMGRKDERINFAHQTSATIDNILEGIKRLPDETQKEIGPLLLAHLSTLGVIINSYRTKDSRTNTGDFPYPWEDVANPLEVYRDIGIQLGFSRAKNAPETEPNVRKEGRLGLLLPENQPGQLGFEYYRKLFTPLPEISASIKKHLIHTNFAVLILLSIKQAFYHTLRSRILGHEFVCISVNVTESEGETIFECQILNPIVKEEDKFKTSKDAIELSELANKLSDIPDHSVSYSIEGPYFDFNQGQWLTKTRIHSKTQGYS
ncbi:MAG: hypothetical protein NTY50_01135 [Methylobacter sp.]|nr:hypothetical protein [Methylobacter sp.]